MKVATKRSGTDVAAADVHDRLRTKIITLELKPGTRLVEDDISAMLNVGRTPVREALLRLQGEGLVNREKGWVVESVDPSNVTTIFESRQAIEGFATRLAAARVGKAELNELRALVDEMDRADEIPRSQVNRLNRAFHEKIVALSGNPFFLEMHEKTQFHYWNLRLPVVFTREQTKMANDQHRRILEALAKGNLDDAEAAAREHIETTFAIVKDALDSF
ncbi:GntR family transcriptional regulator [Microvirga sp. TS319]|uniref:GntR family transcriptional regulator n=1 Tax=Microvirga sp. TS319 TaxID=3241165 RepID=UPI003519EFD1